MFSGVIKVTWTERPYSKKSNNSSLNDLHLSLQTIVLEWIETIFLSLWQIIKAFKMIAFNNRE